MKQVHSTPLFVLSQWPPLESFDVWNVTKNISKVKTTSTRHENIFNTSVRTSDSSTIGRGKFYIYLLIYSTYAFIAFYFIKKEPPIYLQEK